MAVDKLHLRHCILYEFQQGRNATDASKNLTKIFGDGAVSDRTCRRWFEKFQLGDFDLEDKPRSGRPTIVDDDAVITMLEQNPFLTTSEIATRLNSAQQTVSDHILKLGLVWKCSRWVPKELSDKNLNERLATCASLLARNRVSPFLDRVVTGGEKWITYENVARKRVHSEGGKSGPRLSMNKGMLCVWWDVRGPIHYELLKPDETLNSERYCQQLENLRAAIKETRPHMFERKNIILHHYNVRAYAGLGTCRRIAEFGWEILPHPQYSPDLSPSDYHMFLSLHNFFKGKKFKNDDDVKQCLVKFFESREDDFFQRGIYKLPSHWQAIIDNDGNYIIE